MSFLPKKSTLTWLALAALTTFANAAWASATSAPRDMDVPFIVSPPAVTQAMLDIAKVTRHDFVIDLGAGDGRIVILAAKTHGARGLGVEIDPRLVEVARAHAEKAGVAARAHFRVEDLFATDLSPASVITMYLLPDVNLALRPKLLALQPGIRIVSHDWDMGDWRHDDMRVVANPDKTVGLEKTSKIFLWTVPANVGGKWCARQANAAGTPSRMLALEVVQQYQNINGTLTVRAGENKPTQQHFRTTLDGRRLVIPIGGAALPAVADNDRITLTMPSQVLVFQRGGC